MVLFMTTPSNGNIFCVGGPLCVRGIHRSPVVSLNKGQWRGALMFSLIYAWTSGCANNRDADDLTRHHPHYDVTVMLRYVMFICYMFMYSRTLALVELMLLLIKPTLNKVYLTLLYFTLREFVVPLEGVEHSHISPGQIGRLFADDISKWIFYQWKVLYIDSNSTKFVFKGPTDKKQHWSRLWDCSEQATSHYLN